MISSAMLTTVKTHSSSSEVVPPSSETVSAPFSEPLALTTQMIRPKAIAVVNRIAIHGVRRPCSTLPSTGGSTNCLAMP